MLFKTVVLKTVEKSIIRLRPNPAWFTVHAFGSVFFYLFFIYLFFLQRNTKRLKCTCMFHIKTWHDDTVCDERLRTRRVQMSQFSVDKSSHVRCLTDRQWRDNRLLLSCGKKTNKQEKKNQTNPKDRRHSFLANRIDNKNIPEILHLPQTEARKHIKNMV